MESSGTTLNESQVGRVVAYLVEQQGYDPEQAEREVRAGKWDDSPHRGPAFGRPPKLRTERARLQVAVRFTRAEVEALKRAAGDEPVATWARRKLLEAVRERGAS